MKRERASLVGTLALLVMLTHAAAAQSMPTDPGMRDTSNSTMPSGGGGTKIPVNGPEQTEVLGAETTSTSTVAPPVSLERPIDPNTYICGPGDGFELNFWGQQNFRLRLSADLEGRLFITKVGFVDIASKTLATVRAQVAKKVRANYPGLQFELTLASPRTFLVHVVQNVKQPGVLTARPIERVSSVLARAGGITGSKRRITIHHRDGSEATADLVLYELTGDTKYNPFLIDGDVVSVPFADLTVAISGAVHRPGSYELVKTKDLAELIDLAGGFTSGVARSLPIRIVRRSARLEEKFQDIAIGTGTPNAPLHDEEKVLVPGSDELQRSVLLIGAVVGAENIDAAATSKRLAFVDGDTVRSLIDRAGGIKAPGDLRRSYISRPQAGGPPKVIPIDLDALLVRRDFHADVPISMGDTIVIPPMQYSILVEGAVSRAGLYNYNPLFGVSEYVAQAGGRTHNAKSLDDAKLIDQNGGTHSFQRGMKLHPGDAILVPERDWTRAEVVQLVLGGAGLVLSAIAVTYAVTR